jgi:glycogen debranching enzyme
MTSAETGAVTVVEGTQFCRSSPTGDVVPGTSQGLFVRDTRVLSRWELRLDGEAPRPLAVSSPDAYTARFVLRGRPEPGLADSTLLVVRDRTVDDGLQETLTLTNLAAEPADLTIAIHVGADFADLFAVKDGRPVDAAAGAEVGTGTLVLSSVDGSRGLELRAGGEPLVTSGSLVWRTVIAARSSWTATVLMRPTAAAPHGPPGVASMAQRRVRDWQRSSTRVDADERVLAAVLRRTEADLGALRIESPDGLAYIAAGVPWFMTLFGRDSLLTGWMTLPLQPGLALGTLETLARVQGTREDPRTEEQPGRILHELRLGPGNEGTLGGSHYYGSIDATPLFVMLLAECLRWGADPTRVRALVPAADAALAWVQQYGDRDGDGFVEYLRATDKGLDNQGWKDSFDAISDRSGRLAEPPIALCEVQGYVYAAYLARAYLARTLSSGDPRPWLDRAARLRTAFHERFWLPDLGWYALGLDAAKDPVDALTSNGAHALWTGIATDEAAGALVSHLADLDSGYGLRTLGARMGRYNPMSYHNGSVWPHDTAIAVAGLLRYAHVPGAVELATRLAEGLVDAAGEFGGRLPELFCGFGRAEFSPPVPYPTSCSPQAWASAAPLLLVRAFLGLDPDVPARRLALAPRVPGRWGRLSLARLRLGTEVATVSAHGDSATVTGLPSDWSVGGAAPVPVPARRAAVTEQPLPTPRDRG